MNSNYNKRSPKVAQRRLAMNKEKVNMMGQLEALMGCLIRKLIRGNAQQEPTLEDMRMGSWQRILAMKEVELWYLKTGSFYGSVYCGQRIDTRAQRGDGGELKTYPIDRWSLL